MSALLSELRTALGRENVLSAPSELAVYDGDAYALERCRPEIAVLPCTTQQAAEALAICRCYGAPVVARGAGTGLAGGCLPQSGGVLLLLSRMNRVLAVDRRNRMAEVEAGATGRQLADALAGTGFYFAPDPASGCAGTIGGNFAANAAGPHCAACGATVDHVLGVEAVLVDGSILQLGPVDDPAGLDLIGALAGSEGTLAVVTKVWVRLTPEPQSRQTILAIFNTADDACRAIDRMLAAGIAPAAAQLLNQAAIAAVEGVFHAGLLPDAGAVLLVELEGGGDDDLDRRREQVFAACRQFGDRAVLPVSAGEAQRIQKRCRELIAAAGQFGPNFLVFSAAVPRSRVAEMMVQTNEIGRKHSLRIVGVAQAVEGAIDAILPFDGRVSAQREQVLAAGREIYEACLAAGGAIAARHGVGVARVDWMERFSTPADLEAMRRVRHAFDPNDRLNPGKLVPSRKTPELNS